MGKTKRVAGSDEAAIGVEVVVEPIVVQVPPAAIPVEIPHVAVAVRVMPEICKISSMPLPFEISKNLKAVSNLVSYTLIFYTKYLYFLLIRFDSSRSRNRWKSALS